MFAYTRTAEQLKVARRQEMQVFIMHGSDNQVSLY